LGQRLFFGDVVLVVAGSFAGGGIPTGLTAAAGAAELATGASAMRAPQDVQKVVLASRAVPHVVQNFFMLTRFLVFPAN